MKFDKLLIFAYLIKTDVENEEGKNREFWYLSICKKKKVKKLTAEQTPDDYINIRVF